MLPLPSSIRCLPIRCPSALVIGTLVVVLSGCASSRPSTSPTNATSSQSSVSEEAAETAQQLRTTTKRWEGTPYTLGGTSLRGIDCSAFVQVLYRDVLGVPLARTTREQADAGRAVPADEAQPGDLVFFRPERKQRHVGVYLGDGEFAHASTSQGVTVSPLDASYWQDAYWMTRRILPDFSSSGSPAAPDPDTSSTQRAGW